MSNEAKIHLSLNSGTFEISGSEEFVSQQIENFKDLILDSIKNRQSSQTSLEKPNTEHKALEAEATPRETTKSYNRVLHIEDKDIRIIKKIPGTNNASKTVNTALVYLWGSHSAGVTEVPLQEIRARCQEQSCLDASNFSSHINGAKELIIVTGKKGSSAKTCKLTIPGSEKAEEILENLNGA